MLLLVAAPTPINIKNEQRILLTVSLNKTLPQLIPFPQFVWLAKISQHSSKLLTLTSNKSVRNSLKSVTLHSWHYDITVSVQRQGHVTHDNKTNAKTAAVSSFEHRCEFANDSVPLPHERLHMLMGWSQHGTLLANVKSHRLLHCALRLIFMALSTSSTL